MMNKIDPLNQTVVINGRCYGVTTIDFEHVMGLRDGGIDIDFCWKVSESFLDSIHNKLVGSRYGDIIIG